MVTLGGRPMKRRMKHFIGQHIRQVPCLDAVVRAIPDKLRFWRRRRYQTLGQGEDEDGTEVGDQRQDLNYKCGSVLVKLGFFFLIAVTVLCLMQTETYGKDLANATAWSDEEWNEAQFLRDAPLLMYVGACELLICGACAQTAANLYTRRRHALKHPQEFEEEHKKKYVKIDLKKDRYRNESQLYGLGFRVSTDGLEVLIVDDIRTGSLLDLWNKKHTRSRNTASSSGAGEGGMTENASASEVVFRGAAVVAVNNVSADIGMMQVELMKPSVSLWVRSEMFHASQLEDEVLADDPEPALEDNSQEQNAGGQKIGKPTQGLPSLEDGEDERPGPTFGEECEDPSANEVIGLHSEVEATAGPRCACLAYEDEEPQILTRWLVCSIVFGWVTMLPVLLMQPHESRPRQQLFRQYLLKPCVLIMPLWGIAWSLDCIEVFFEYMIFSPFFYFLVIHMVFPAVIVWFLMKLQAADERLVLEQRKSREGEAKKENKVLQPSAVEDPSPTLIKELLCVNPIALVLLGILASIPIVASSLLTPMKTERAKMAQGFLHLVYTPMIMLQLFTISILRNVAFVKLPGFYITGFSILLSAPCFIVWCVCLACASRYGQQDMALVQRQRQERAKKVAEEANKALPGASQNPFSDVEAGPNQGRETSVSNLIDLTEAMHRENELIFTA